jgi:ligand-binding sensor domain-containing protein
MKARLAMWWLMALLLTSLLTPRNGQGSEFSHQFISTKFTTNNSGLPHDSVSAVAATPDGLWVGTYEGGLARFHQGQWQSYTTKNSALPSDSLPDTLLSYYEMVV